MDVLGCVGAGALLAGKLIGIDKRPLRDESALSVVSRLAQWNVFRKKLLRKATGKRFRTTLQVGALEAIIEGLTGWQWSEESLFHCLPLFVRHALEADRLRFCPVCLQCEFHSHWFQLVPLVRCPLHGCDIVDRCVHCGHQSERFNAYLDRDWLPYRCANCRQLIFGAPSLFEGLEGFDDLMASEEWIYERFLPVRRWFQAIAEKSRFFAEAYYPCQAMYHAGGLDAEYRLSVLNRIVPFPAALRQPLRLDLTVLKWDVPAFCANGWQQSRAKMERSNETLRRLRFQTNVRRFATFLATARKIERHMPTKASDRPMYTNGHHTIPFDFDSRWNPEAVSLELVRQAFYPRGYVRGRGWRYDSSEKCIDESHAWPYEAHHVDRLCTRAATLCAFSVMRGVAYDWKRRGVIDRDSAGRCIGRQILIRTCSAYDAFGIAIFPTVDWLRLDPFRDVSYRMGSLIDQLNSRLLAHEVLLDERWKAAHYPQTPGAPAPH